MKHFFIGFALKKIFDKIKERKLSDANETYFFVILAMVLQNHRRGFQDVLRFEKSLQSLKIRIEFEQRLFYCPTQRMKHISKISSGSKTFSDY